MQDKPAILPSSARSRVYRLLESDRPTTAAKWLRLLIGLLIVANVAAVVLESHRELWQSHETLFGLFEKVSVAIFTIEYVLRLWSSAENPKFSGASPWRARRAYALSLVGLVDLLAIAPFYLAFVVPWDLRQLRAVRLLRLLKLSRYFNSLDVFFAVIRSQVPTLLGASLIVLILVVFSSSMMYAVESRVQPEAFGSVSRAVWWSVVTLTTVGYGDVTPVTTLGKILGIVIMLLGVGMVALPAAILAGRFSDELQFRREKISRKVAGYLTDGQLDDMERRRIAELGQDAGFSDEEIGQITEQAEVSADYFRRCPRCGYTQNDGS